MLTSGNHCTLFLILCIHDKYLLIQLPSNYTGKIMNFMYNLAAKQKEYNGYSRLKNIFFHYMLDRCERRLSFHFVKYCFECAKQSKQKNISVGRWV